MEQGKINAVVTGNVLNYQINIRQNSTPFFQFVHLDDIQTARKENWELTFRHDFYCLASITKGRGVQSVDFKDYEFHDEDLFFIDPFRYIKCKTFETTAADIFLFSGIFLELCSSNIQELLYLIFLVKPHCLHYIKPNDTLKKKIAQFFKLIQEETECGIEMFKQDRIASYLSLILIDIMRYGQWNSQELQTDLKDKSLEKFIMLIEEHYKTIRDVKTYAKMIGISETSLNRLTNKHLQYSPLELIHMRIIHEAKQYIKLSNLTIKEISAELNFNSVAYFVRFFKKNTGLTPLEFRNL